MEEVKRFIEEFFKVEANTATLKRVPDLDNYNSSVRNLDAFLIESLKGAWGYQIIDELEEEDIYEMLEGIPDDIPRHLFKISQYSHEKYGDVWVSYVSIQNPDSEHKVLNEIIVIIKEGKGLKIATKFGYSRYDSNGTNYEWKIEAGQRELTFESLEGPIKIERYQLPVDSFDGLKHYNDDV